MPSVGSTAGGLSGRAPWVATGRVVLAVATLILALIGSQATWADAGRTVAPGDELRVTIREAPDLSHTGTVGLDGLLMLPVLGSVPVEGMTLDSIAGFISDALQKRDLIRQATVLVEMASYRPVFIGGIVGKPGRIDFEPGLTARQAIMTAGGITTQDTREAPGRAELAKLAATRRGLEFELEAVNSRIERTETELELVGKSVTPRPADAAGADTGEKTTGPDSIAALDAAVLSDRLTNQQTEREYFEKRLKLLELEITFLTKQREMQEEERSIQQDEITNARVLVERGLMRRPQFQEMQREASRMGRDALETEAYAARAKQAIELLRQEVDDAATNRRIELRSLLREDLARRAAIGVEIESLDADLLASGLAMADASEIRQFEPVVTVHRRGPRGVEQITVGMDDLLEPGDVVELGLNSVPGG